MRTLQAVDYSSADGHQRERHEIFGREWLCLGSAHAVREPGSYLAETIAGWPLLVVRDSEGMLRAFHNVCRHRAGPLVDDGCGSVRSLVCRYHGWAYGLDGSLRSARDSGLDPADVDGLELFAVQVAEWRGVLFACLEPNAPPLDAWLGDLAAECESFPMESWQPSERMSHHLACNWKTYGDNYLEGYHIPLLHPELNRQFDAKQYRVELGHNYCRHTAPPRDGSPADGRWLFRWPNLAMNIYGDSMNVEVIVPTGPESCSVSYSHFFVDPNGADVADVIALADTVMEQDRRIVEAVQRNLAAGTYQGGLLSPRHENGLLQFQDLVRAAEAPSA
jgi:choline monooxygenase